MKARHLLALTATTAALCTVMTIATAVPAAAQGGACYDLWYERNEIYARNGYCFRTARARSVFGPGCFPPYGRLSREENRRVREIQNEEDSLGCPR